MRPGHFANKRDADPSSTPFSNHRLTLAVRLSLVLMLWLTGLDRHGSKLHRCAEGSTCEAFEFHQRHKRKWDTQRELAGKKKKKMCETEKGSKQHKP